MKPQTDTGSLLEHHDLLQPLLGNWVGSYEEDGATNAYRLTIEPHGSAGMLRVTREFGKKQGNLADVAYLGYDQESGRYALWVVFSDGAAASYSGTLLDDDGGCRLEMESGAVLNITNKVQARESWRWDHDATALHYRWSFSWNGADYQVGLAAVFERAG